MIIVEDGEVIANGNCRDHRSSNLAARWR
jgi:hypothetical protein